MAKRVIVLATQPASEPHHLFCRQMFTIYKFYKYSALFPGIQSSDLPRAARAHINFIS